MFMDDLKAGINLKYMFSVVIPLYNKSAYILRSIESVLGQSYGNLELLIVDDGSTDDSLDKVKLHVKDSRLKIIEKENGGVSSARNRGIKEATFRYVSFLDADDCWHPEFLRNVARVISDHPNAEIIGVKFKEVLFSQNCNGHELLDENINFVKVGNYFQNASKYPLFHSSSTVVNVSVFENVGYFDESLTHGEDLDMWFRIMIHVNEAFYIPHYLSFYFIGEENQATNKLPVLKRHLVGCFLEKYKYAYLNSEIPFFRTFFNEYLLINLRPFYMRDSEAAQVKRILCELVSLGGKINWFYAFPRCIVKGIYLIKKMIF